MAEQVRGDIAQKTTSLVQPRSKPPVNGPPHPHLPPNGHSNHNNTDQTQNNLNNHIKPRSFSGKSLKNGYIAKPVKSSKPTRKIRLIIPRKRKLQQIESTTNSKSIPSDCKHQAINQPKTENGQEPPPKKQKLSPTQQQPLNEIKAPNHPKPQPSVHQQPIMASLPPPPPLQNLSPPPSASPNRCNPYKFLQNQLRTHYKWPTKNSDGIDYTHICSQCGQGFMSTHALNVHKEQHQRAQNQITGENTYYYPNNHKQQPLTQPVVVTEEKKKTKIEEKTEKKVIKKRKSDKHNKRDKDGNYPRHDVDGNLYAFFCDVCGKGFSLSSSFNGHRVVHKRMEKMGKYYNKQSGKHEFKIDIERRKREVESKMNGKKKKKKKIKKKIEEIEVNEAEYANLSKKEIMNKIMDKLEQMDEEKLFFSADQSKEFTDQIDEPLSFQILRNRIQNDKYRSIQQMKSDLNKLFRSVFRVYDETHVRWKMALKLKQFAYKQIMAAITPSIHPNMRTKQKNKNNKIGENQLSIIKTEGYVEISDYEFFCDDDVLETKMKCKKKVSCDGKCCSKFSELGPYSIHSEQWKSNCLCRSKSMECTDDCKCDPLVCKNRAIKQKKDKKMNECVREQEVFGIDQHTRNCLERALPKEIALVFPQIESIKECKSAFIEKLLLPAINNYNFFIIEHAEYKSKYDPNLMVKAQESEAEFMITDVFRSMLFVYRSNELVQRTLSYLIHLILNMGHCELTNDSSSIEGSKRRIKWSDPILDYLALYEESDLDVSGEDIICHVNFPIYSKGLGVVCTSTNGIASNEYIISFLGVVYSPWSWYEKDDRTRWLIKRANAPKAAEFFNIMLERHKDDPSGYDLVFVDPHFRGNYGSRLSHSCAPNCISVTMGVSDKYRIAVYASQDIAYGEELCFDYNSVTESEQEWRNAVCLCGRHNCRGQFLIYAGTTLYTEVMKEYHHGMHRTANLFNCCMPNTNDDDEEEEAYKQRLRRYSLKESVLNGIPQFIQKYAATICKFIDFEQAELPKVLNSKALNGTKGYEQFKNLINAEEECKGLQYVRLSNLVITLNKINLFYRQPVNHNLMNMPLFKRVDTKELIERIWFAQSSIIADLVMAIAIHCGQQHKIVQLIKKYRKNLMIASNKVDMSKSSEYLMDLRVELLKLSPTNSAYHHGAADVLLWWASTEYFFEFSPPLQGFQSRQFSYRELGYLDAANCGNPPAKKYNSQYIWGQCNFWERHTIESPDSSLSAERRGTICLPNIKCCYAQNRETRIKKAYEYDQRAAIIKHIEWKNQCSWSTRWHFSFKNGALYGSPWLDSYIDASHKQKLQTLIETMKNAKVCYPDGTLTAITEEEEDEEYTNEDDDEKERVVVVAENEKEKMDVDEDDGEDDRKEEEGDDDEKQSNKRRSVRLRGKERKNYLDPHVPQYWKKNKKK